MKRIVLLFTFFLSVTASADLNLDTKFEVRTAPVPLYMGRWITLDATMFLNDQWAIGPSYISYADRSEYGNMFWPSWYGNAYGAHAIWAVDNLFINSWYIGGHAYYESYRAKAHGYGPGEQEDVRGYRANAVIGFRQFSGSFLTMVGLGYESRLHDIKKANRYTGYSEFRENRSWFHAEFKAGWMF